ncbi:hypothetical protein DAPPUDRAFT_118121 [Daphnia pulex]|uniref:Uncharacterized protein n=1 Tax=Daphnia pulex TaxID=6669 RepID=E9HUT5_DAPPU|nr:hypothetical protein DAPPUDRAFT_118121 [Daphnia pulex]|eukprot:EFX64495.1 hypothetical protein DAPPUDRAFT_118121 [Daphnia pulex]
MSERSKEPAVSFQTFTRATTARRAGLSSASSSSGGSVAVSQPSPTRPSRISARLSPAPMATNDDLIQALTAFTQAAANDRVLQQQKHDDLLQALRTQQDENTALRNLVTAGRAVVNRPSTAVVDSIPKFEVRMDEDVQGFINHIDRVATSEDWTDHRLQVGIRRLTIAFCRLESTNSRQSSTAKRIGNGIRAG